MCNAAERGLKMGLEGWGGGSSSAAHCLFSLCEALASVLRTWWEEEGEEVVGGRGGVQRAATREVSNLDSVLGFGHRIFLKNRIFYPQESEDLGSGGKGNCGWDERRMDLKKIIK